ncbi:hypothetical protein VHEMI10730 [[Torrubiella] hemipterigena]|uniref:Protein kinase domain-containing protein n=1 Tax=[Torrubiella] hemipterigena TaxID=1531966 RepID=A0A0A1TJH2_9HYPO|nr:hypothetical protein VHEMI10730 [[Torrubiella] hemipterigena]
MVYTSSVASSQRTNENSPRVPPKSNVFFELVPYNAEAKLQFSNLVCELRERRGQFQQAVDDQEDSESSVWQYLFVSDEQIHDAEVAQLRRELVAQTLSSSPLSSPQESSSMQAESLIWSGGYSLDLEIPPKNPKVGWKVGRVRVGSNPNQLALTFSKAAGVNVRQNHAIIQITETGRVSVERPQHAKVSVDGEAIEPNQPHVLTKEKSFVTFGSLTFKARYLPVSSDEVDSSQLFRQYMEKHADIVPSPFLGLVQTPSEEHTMRIGKWTVSAVGIIGKGSSGKVSVGFDSSGQVVAMKRISITKNKYTPSILGQIENFKKISSIAKAQQVDLIVTLVDIIDNDPMKTNSDVDIWLLLSPVIACTLLQRHQKRDFSRTFTQADQKIILVRVLRGIKFIHSAGFIVSDVKPSNIGLRDENDPNSVVLLDIDGAILAPTPEAKRIPHTHIGGTISWLSPEREMHGFDGTADLWSLGVLGFLLVEGFHPWDHKLNPWRPGRLKEQNWFHEKYRMAMMCLEQWPDKAFATAIKGVLRHPYAETDGQRQPRLPTEDVLHLLMASPDSEDQVRASKRGKFTY